MPSSVVADMLEADLTQRGFEVHRNGGRIGIADLCVPGKGYHGTGVVLVSDASTSLWVIGQGTVGVYRYADPDFPKNLFVEIDKHRTALDAHRAELEKAKCPAA